MLPNTVSIAAHDVMYNKEACSLTMNDSDHTVWHELIYSLSLHILHATRDVSYIPRICRASSRQPPRASGLDSIDLRVSNMEKIIQ